MFGPLPRFHRMTIAAIVLAFSVAIGLWMGAYPRVPVLTTGGVALGLAVGAALAWLTVHDGGHERPAALRLHRRR